MKSSLHNIKVYKEKLFSTRQEKGLKRLRRLYRYKLGLLNKKYIDILGNLKDFQLKVFIRVRPNNVFCTLKNLNSGKILINRSSGIYNLQISKKKLKYNIKMMLQFSQCCPAQTLCSADANQNYVYIDGLKDQIYFL